MDAPCSQNFLDHGHAFFHAHMLVLNHATNFIKHFDRTLIVGDEQSLQDFLEIINLSRPRSTLQCRMSSNFLYKIVDYITHGYLHGSEHYVQHQEMPMKTYLLIVAMAIPAQ